MIVNNINYNIIKIIKTFFLIKFNAQIIYYLKYLQNFKDFVYAKRIRALKVKRYAEVQQNNAIPLADQEKQVIFSLLRGDEVPG